MNPRIPKEFEIKGHIWRVEYRWSPRMPDGTMCYAICHEDTRTIEIDRAIPKEEKWRWFWHELKHAMLYELHLVAPADGGLTETQQGVICEGFPDILLTLFDIKWKRRRRK